MLALLSVAIQLEAQEISPDEFQVTRQLDYMSIGLGGGLDHGGFGANFLYYTNKNVGVFGGVGYALAGVGFNAGAKFRYVSDKAKSKIDPYCLVMYGYNAAIAVSGGKQYNKLFYGPTVGVGIDFRGKPKKKTYWTLAILLPIRSSDVGDYIDDLEDNHGVEFSNGLLPVAFSISYRFILN